MRLRMTMPEEKVPDGCECVCGEDRIDWLIFDDEGVYVTCASCGNVFNPLDNNWK